MQVSITRYTIAIHEYCDEDFSVIIPECCKKFGATQVEQDDMTVTLALPRGFDVKEMNQITAWFNDIDDDDSGYIGIFDEAEIGALPDGAYRRLEIDDVMTKRGFVQTRPFMIGDVELQTNSLSPEAETLFPNAKLHLWRGRFMITAMSDLDWTEFQLRFL